MGIRKFRKSLRQSSLGLLLFLTCGVVCFMSCSRTTQPIIESGLESAQLEEEELKTRLLQHKRLMHNCFKDYMQYCSMVDTSGTVTMEALERFKSLFMTNAKVWNDVVDNPKMVYAVDYADHIYDYLEGSGVKVEFEENVLNRFYSIYDEMFEAEVVAGDEDNKTMRYKFEAQKLIYYKLDNENNLIIHEKPEVHALKFIFYVSSVGQWAKIMDIKPLNY